MKQPFILTLLMIAAISTAAAQHRDGSANVQTAPQMEQCSDSSQTTALIAHTDQSILTPIDTPANTSEEKQAETQLLDLNQTAHSTASFGYLEGDTETEPIIRISKKTPKKTSTVAMGPAEPQKKKTRIRISLFKKPEGEEQTRRVLWRDGRWAGIGIHYSGLVTNLGNFSLPAGAERLTQSAKSIGVTLNPVDFILVGNQTVRLMTGLGFELNNFRFDQDVTLKYENGVTTVDEQYLAQGVNLTKSKLFTAYMNIPLLIEFQIGRNRNFFINGGVVGGLRIGAHTKIQGKGAIVGGTAKDHSSFGLRNFHYGYTINFGYSHIGFNLTYYHSPLWRKGAGPQARQVNAGISLVF